MEHKNKNGERKIERERNIRFTCHFLRLSLLKIYEFQMKFGGYNRKKKRRYTDSPQNTFFKKKETLKS